MSRLMALQWLAAAALCSAVVGLYAGSHAPQSAANPGGLKMHGLFLGLIVRLQTAADQKTKRRGRYS